MFRRIRWALGVSALLATVGAGQARAQWGYSYPGGYGGYGWNGWSGGGATVQGNVARGLGYYAAGEGVYNEDTAVANSINTDTVLRWNQYWYDAQKEASRNENARMARREARDSGASAALEKQIRENPTDADIMSGNALNVALDEISDPRVHSSTLRLAKDKIPGKVVRDIPFVNASEAVTISLDQLTAENGWPIALRDSKFDDERKAYSAAIDKALKEDEDGDLKPATIEEVRAALAKLKAKLVAMPPTDPAVRGEAYGYLKTLYGMTRMLERPDVEKLIAEAESIKETSLGSLLGFMHNFNLRFGRANTPAQKAAYATLYPLIDSHRDRVTADAGTRKTADGKGEKVPPPPKPADFYTGMNLDHLDGPHRLDKSTKK